MYHVDYCLTPQESDVDNILAAHRFLPICFGLEANPKQPPPHPGDPPLAILALEDRYITYRACGVRIPAAGRAQEGEPFGRRAVIRPYAAGSG